MSGKLLSRFLANNRSVAGEPEERLTANLYAFVRLESFRIRLRSQPGRDVPRVILEVDKWTILSPSKRVPLSHRSAREIGTQPGDERVRAILKAWWTGLSLSSSVAISSAAPTAERPSSHISELFSEPTPRAAMPPPPAPMEEKLAVGKVSLFRPA